MERVLHRNSRVIVFIRVLLAAFLVTGLLLTLLSFIMLKTSASSGMLFGGIIVTYILSTIVGGFLFGKGAEKRRFLWGLGFGLIYAVILLMFSLVANPFIEVDFTRGMIAAIVCGIGGMLGAILS